MNSEQVKNFDVAIIGGGIGGYSAAIRAAQLKKNVVLINSGPIGGTCLNIGCIPTKALLHSAKLYREIHEASVHGIVVEGAVKLDWDLIQKRKKDVVDNLVSGIDKLIERNAISYIAQKASFVNENSLVLEDGTIISAQVIIIATGSRPFIPPIEGAQLNGVIDSEKALSLKQLPKDIVIIGAGAIGLEFAQIFSTFGVNTTVIEMLEQVGGTLDSDIADLVEKNFSKLGVDIKTGCIVELISNSADGLCVSYRSDAQLHEICVENVLIATGRKPIIDGLNLEKIGVKISQGRIAVDEFMKTSVSGIYAIGDVSSAIMLAHVAEDQGILAVESAFGLAENGFKYIHVPSCIYTDPEIASIGMTEDALKKAEKSYRVGLFPLYANGKAVIENQVENTVIKLLFDTEYDELLGAHIYGPSATELIAEMSLGSFLETTAQELISTIHPHPTLSEAIKEAALDSKNRAIHNIR